MRIFQIFSYFESFGGSVGFCPWNPGARAEKSIIGKVSQYQENASWGVLAKRTAWFLTLITWPERLIDLFILLSSHLECNTPKWCSIECYFHIRSIMLGITMILDPALRSWGSRRHVCKHRKAFSTGGFFVSFHFSHNILAPIWA